MVTQNTYEGKRFEEKNIFKMCICSRSDQCLKQFKLTDFTREDVHYIQNCGIILGQLQ